MRKKLKLIKKASGAHVQRLKKLTKKPLFTIPIATFMVLLACVMTAILVSSDGKPNLLSNDSNIVVLNYDKQERAIPTRAKTVGELIKRLEIPLHQGDVIEPSQDTEIIGDNFRINIYRAVPVTIVDGNQKTFTYSAAATPRSILKQSGIEVYPEDRLELLPTENFLTESSIGERVVIKRATPVALNLYGTQVSIRTQAKTVKELITERNIHLDKDDTIQPLPDTKITPNTQVFLVRKGTQLKTIEEAVPMPIEQVEDSTLTFGATAVRQQGSPGKRLVTYQIDLQNGQEVGRKKIQEVVSVEPVKQIVAKGKAFSPSSDKAAVMAAAGIRESDFPYVDYIVSRESRWNHLAKNATSGAYGLCQAYPGTKMASTGSDWQTNPVTQLKWCDGYAKGRYGTWAAAYNYWVANKHW